MDILILISTILLWGIVHSILASVKFGAFLRQRLGPGVMRGYRLFYNFFALLSFLPILWLMHILPDKTLFFVPVPWVFLLLAGQGLAGLCLLLAVLQTDPLSFVGLRQVLEGEKPSVLVTWGFYRLVRHPLYLFGLLFLWLTPIMTLNLLIVYVSLTIYIFVGAYFEERKLAREFGTSYLEYKARTPMIIPGPLFKRGS